MISIVLVKPRLSGNVGAIARVMKNFSVKELILIEPHCNPKSQTAKNRAKWANDVLDKAKIRTWKNLDKFDTIIATSGKIGNDYNIMRTPIRPDEARNKVKGKTAILFGPEDRGLLNEELAKADFLVTIPSNPKYPILNLSHSVAVMLYALNDIEPDKTSYASGVEKKIIEREFSKVLKKLEFPTPDKKETQKKVWRRVIGRSNLTKREAFSVVGFYKRLINALSKK